MLPLIFLNNFSVAEGFLSLSLSFLLPLPLPFSPFFSFFENKLPNEDRFLALTLAVEEEVDAGEEG